MFKCLHSLNHQMFLFVQCGGGFTWIHLACVLLGNGGCSKYCEKFTHKHRLEMLTLTTARFSSNSAASDSVLLLLQRALNNTGSPNVCVCAFVCVSMCTCETVHCPFQPVFLLVSCLASLCHTEAVRVRVRGRNFSDIFASTDMSFNLSTRLKEAAG